MSSEPTNRIGRSAGFTLIELLIVIAILGILVAMVFPALNSARQSSRSNSCRNNLRQMWFAVQQYSGTHQDMLPATWRTARPRPWDNFSWRVELLPYLEQDSLRAQFKLEEPPFSDANRQASRGADFSFSMPFDTRLTTTYRIDRFR